MSQRIVKCDIEFDRFVGWSIVADDAKLSNLFRQCGGSNPFPGDDHWLYIEDVGFMNFVTHCKKVDVVPVFSLNDQLLTCDEILDLIYDTQREN